MEPARRSHMKTAILICSVACRVAVAQSPAGVIEGLVTDPSGAAVTGSRLTVTNRATGLRRVQLSGPGGEFGFAYLPAAEYEVTAQADGFNLLVCAATVEAGATTLVRLSLQVGDVTNRVTVEDASPQIEYDHHQVGGVVTRGQIESLPLNGRNFLELAKLEPGVAPPVRSNFNITQVSML